MTWNCSKQDSWWSRWQPLESCRSQTAVVKTEPGVGERKGSGRLRETGEEISLAW